MGWATGTNNEGRPVGYAVPAVCDQPGCTTAIDRGVAYACGGMHDGGEHGCGRYFCATHLLLGPADFLCSDCIQNFCPECSSDDPSLRHTSPSSNTPCDDPWHDTTPPDAAPLDDPIGNLMRVRDEHAQQQAMSARVEMLRECGLDLASWRRLRALDPRPDGGC